MAIDKAYYNQYDVDPMKDDVEIEVTQNIPLTADNVFEMDDGSAYIGENPDAPDELPPMDQVPHNANLVAYFDDNELSEIARDIIAAQAADDEARSEWKDRYIKGLDLLGMSMEDREEPFPGASGVHHPLLAEAVVQFQAQAYKELLPAGGPVLSKVLGDETPDRLEQAARVQDFLNYLITDVMEEYDPDMDQLLLYLPLGGSAFKKTYFDPSMERSTSPFITADHITVPYSATSLKKCKRIVHDFLLNGNDILKYQATGFYADSHLTKPPTTTPSAVQEKEDELHGLTPSVFDHDEEYQIFEAHVELDHERLLSPEGIALPYVVTLDKDSETVLAIRRNYKEGDPLFERLEHFTHYKFLPGLGFYGFGLIHMIGGLTQAATSILRQLIDAGTFANFQGGFKAKGMRVAGEDEPIGPGEWRDVDTPGGNLRESLLPIPYKEPSQVLAGLLGSLVETGQRFASIADMQVGDTSGQQQPVGTTIAMLERGTKVMSSIHKRLHYAQKSEFQILARIVADSLPEDEIYPYATEGSDKSIGKKDFDQRVDIIPVSDPNIFSMAQRVMLASQQLEMAQAAPEIHNLREAYYRMYKAMGISDIESILKPPEQPKNLTPLEEHRRVLENRKLEAVPEMNHQAHIEMHLQMLEHPFIKNNVEFASNLAQDIMSHVSMMAKLQMGMTPDQIRDPQMQQGGSPQMQKPVDSSQLEMQMMAEIMPRMTPPEPSTSVEQLQERQLDIDEAYNKGRLANEKLKIARDAEVDMLEMGSKERIEKGKLEQSGAQLRSNADTARRKIAADMRRDEMNARTNMAKNSNSGD